MASRKVSALSASMRCASISAAAQGSCMDDSVGIAGCVAVARYAVMPAYCSGSRNAGWNVKPPSVSRLTRLAVLRSTMSSVHAAWEFSLAVLAAANATRGVAARI